MSALNRVGASETDPIRPDGGARRNRNPKHYPFPDPDYGEGYKFEPDFQGPVRKRGCTDVICLLLFLAFLGGWGFVAYFAASQGDIEKVLYPTNSRGEVCGRPPNQDRPVLLFFDLTRCLNPAVLSLGCKTKQVCVQKCPDFKYSPYALATTFTSEAVKAVMRPFCDQVSDEEWSRSSASELISRTVCPAWFLPSTNVLGRCLPSLMSSSNASQSRSIKAVVSAEETGDKPIDEKTLTDAVTMLGAFLSLRNFGERVFNDLGSTWWMILLGYLAATIISFLWIVLMRFVAGIMVWVSVGLVFCLFGGLFGYTLYRYLILKDLPEAQANFLEVNFTPDYGKDLLALKDTWLAFAIICGIVFCIILLVLIALRSRIALAIELIEEASKAVAQMFSTLAFPIFPFALQAAVAVFFAGIALFLSSAGEAEHRVSYPGPGNITIATSCPSCVNPLNQSVPFAVGDLCNPLTFNTSCLQCPRVTCQFTKYVKKSEATWMQWYNLFGLYWGMFFASALSELALAGAFAAWYWTWNKSSDVPCCAISVSLFNAVFFHLGTVAFGSVIIAIIRMVRTIVSYIAEKLKLYNNDLTRCLICLCKCCLYCLEKFMQFINRNAYIMCAVKGTNFCVSARDAFSLLMRNVVRVVVLNNIVHFLLFLAKLVIVCGVGCLAYFVFSGGIPEIKDEIPTLNYFQAPIVVTVLGAYVISSLFFGVYEMAVDTLFLCFLEDLERNDGTPEKPYFMSRGLQKVVGKMQKFNDDDRDS